jgi:hypothetical protein
MKHQSNARPGLWLAEGTVAALLVATPMIGLSLQQGGSSPQSFTTLKPKAEIIYLLANSSVIVGPDVSGRSEEITFTGTVVVPKYPLKGFERRKLADGKYQIDFELTSSELHGESYLLDGPILLGEHPDLPSLGTITQRTPGQDYPADFIVQRKVLIKTPAGTLHNEAPVPVRGTIDSIPPVRQLQTPTDLDVFRGEQLPVAMLDERGEIGGWFYSKAHLAFAVDPSAVYRFNVSGTVGLSAAGQQEEVAITGPLEVVRLGSGAGTTDEIVAVALRGESRLLGGRIMLVEAFSEKEKFSRGRIPDTGRLDSGFDLFVDIKAPGGTLQVPKAIQIDGTVADLKKTGEVTLSTRTINVYEAAVQFAGVGSNQAIVNDLGRTVAEIRNIKLTSAVPRRGPCCPRKPGER